MRKPTLKSLMTRLEKLAKSEYRDIEGQLRCVLDYYEASRTQPVTQKKREPKASVQSNKKDERPHLILTSPEAVPKKRKVRSDLGKKRGPYKKKDDLAARLFNARKKLAELASQTR